jgi:AraC-like DNA-binding protein
MTDERLYLQPDLKVTDLAKALNTNRVYVQQAIGRSLGTTFSEYVNRRRIDHAVALMKSQPEKSILDIALMSGFSSQASFYRNFNHFLHCSPKELKTLLEEQEKKASNA